VVYTHPPITALLYSWLPIITYSTGRENWYPVASHQGPDRCCIEFCIASHCIALFHSLFFQTVSFIAKPHVHWVLHTRSTRQDAAAFLTGEAYLRLYTAQRRGGWNTLACAGKQQRRRRQQQRPATAAAKVSRMQLVQRTGLAVAHKAGKRPPPRLRPRLPRLPGWRNNTLSLQICCHCLPRLPAWLAQHAPSP
jgi:hypothetical protein